MEMKGLIPFSLVCLAAVWWAKSMGELLLAQVQLARTVKKAKSSPCREPAKDSISAKDGINEELTSDEDIAAVNNKMEEAPLIVAPSMIGPRPVERFVPTRATRTDQRAAKKARRVRKARRPRKFIRRGRVGRFITVTYRVAGELATRCWDLTNLEAFWLPGSPDSDPALAGFLLGRKALPPAD